jgi:periplasmic protein TonB
MYAIEYSKQQRAAPAVVTVAIHFALLYAIAVGLHVVPSPLPRGVFEGVPIPVDPIKPEPKDELRPDPRSNFPDLSFIKKQAPPTIPITQEPPTPHVGEPVIDIGTDDISVVNEAVVNARVKYSPEPSYPLVSRAREEEGTVLVKVLISPYGTAADVQIEKSSGYSRLDDAAIKAVRGWKFAPATRGSRAIATWVTVPVKFVLNSHG